MLDDLAQCLDDYDEASGDKIELKLAKIAQKGWAKN
jgi:hypothetical protein